MSKIKFGFGLSAALVLLISLVSLYALRVVSSTNRALAFDFAEKVIEAEKLRVLFNQKSGDGRTFLLTGNRVMIVTMAQDRARFLSALREMEASAATPEDLDLLNRVKHAEADHQNALEGAIRLARSRSSPAELRGYFASTLESRRQESGAALTGLIQYRTHQLHDHEANAARETAASRKLVIVASALALLVSFLIAYLGSHILAQSRDAIALREEMLSILAHDLKNPLGAIQLNAGLLRRQLAKADRADDAAITRSVERINSASENAARLVYDLLDEVKIRSGRFALEKAACDIPALLKETLDMIRPLAAHKSIALELDWPAPNMPCTLECDRGRIQQVLSNLLGNAIKFTQSGGRVIMRVALRAEEIRFSVSDNGPGIPASSIPYLFDRYWQAKSTQKQGTGLGLSIAQGIILAHGGRIWAESEVGRGSTFYFTLPKAEPTRNVG